MRRLQHILWRFFITLVAGALLLGLACLLFPQQMLTIDSGDVEADVLVVLGGGSNQLRPERAAELFRAGKASKVIVCGTGDFDLNAKLLEKNGVPASAILIESHSTSTLENAKFSIPMLREMGAHRVIIVTSWYHSRRALACFNHFAPDLQFYSRPSYWCYRHRDWNGHGLASYLCFEYVKLIGYWVCYGVCPL